MVMRALAAVTLTCLLVQSSISAERFRVGTFNLENYLSERIATRSGKSVLAKKKIRESIQAMKTDVLALQELGGAAELQELQKSLRMEGLDYPYSELVMAFDTNVHVAVLSRFPIVSRHSHTNDSYLLGGRRFRVLRGFAEVEIQVEPNYRFTLMTAHLKSRRASAEADETEQREQEALLLREKIEAILTRQPKANLVVLGDLNDTKEGRSTRTVIGRGRQALVDTRPAEQNGDDQPPSNPRYDPRNITWTYHYGVSDSYERIDYILLSPGMAREWVKQDTRVVTMTNWGAGSDHRPIVAGFVAQEQ